MKEKSNKEGIEGGRNGQKKFKKPNRGLKKIGDKRSGVGMGWKVGRQGTKKRIRIWNNSE